MTKDELFPDDKYQLSEHDQINLEDAILDDQHFDTIIESDAVKIVLIYNPIFRNRVRFILIEENYKREFLCMMIRGGRLLYLEETF